MAHPSTHLPAAPSMALREAGMVLNLAALDAAGHDLSPDASTRRDGPWCQALLSLLNNALAAEWVCVLRYRRHHFSAAGLASPKIAKEFLVHADQEQAHADRLARRIVQLGGEPDYSPDTLCQRSHAAYDDAANLQQMIRANLVAERAAIEAYSQMITLLGERDPHTRRMLEDILADEQGHADELRDWLTP